jgi:hypothetical protein
VRNTFVLVGVSSPVFPLLRCLGGGASWKCFGWCSGGLCDGWGCECDMRDISVGVLGVGSGVSMVGDVMEVD